MSMSLDGIQNVVLLFSNPVWTGQNTIPSTIVRNLTALSSTMAYSDHITENLTVLVAKYAETQNGVLQGLLYVPDLDAADPCAELAREFVPDTAVRQINLPPTNYNLIALAPWFNAECARAYLVSARLDPLRAFIFYHPSNSSTKPPSVNSPVWNLDDDGDWRTANHYPIFAISGAVGSEMMYQLSRYSGNLSDVPYGENITDIYNPDPSDYVRIWTELAVSTPTGLPNMWVFILAIIGVLLLVITSISFVMHMAWRQRRKSLQQRVMDGEVNLEAMGIKRLTVPLAHVQKFPLFTYNYEPEAPPTAPASPTSPQRSSRRSKSQRTGSQRTGSQRTGSQTTTSQGPADNISSVAAPSVQNTEAISEKPQGRSAVASAAVTDLDYQPTCLICLEDYQNRVTIIRELRCGHIFHPECIDEFLSRISSLCPMCKASMLPKGFCPPITNAMVRRERAIRRLRDRIVVEDSDIESVRGHIHSWGSSVKNRIFSVSHRSPGPGPPVAPLTTLAVELQPRSGGDTAAADADAGLEQGIELRPRQTLREGEGGAGLRQGESHHSEATRQRMRELAGSDIDSDLDGVPLWRRISRQLFPGFQ